MLEKYGICGALLSWLYNFLFERLQTVRVGSAYSEPTNVVSGVPQGTVLGCILFSIFINDVVNCVRHSEPRLFADDIKLFYVHDGSVSTADFQSDINSISEWSKQWQLSLAPQKTQIIYYGVSNPKNSYNIENITIATENTIRDLGVLFDSNLSFIEHTSLIIRKCNRLTRLLFHLFTCYDPQVYVVAYTVYIRPIIEYCSVIYSPATPIQIHKIEKIQKYFTRRVFWRCKKDGFTPYPDRLMFLRLESLQFRRCITDLSMLFKIIKFKTPLIPSLFVTPRISTIPHRTNNYQFRYENSRILCRQHFFSYRVLKYWNSLPNYVIESNNMKTFVNRCRLFYDNDCYNYNDPM